MKIPLAHAPQYIEGSWDMAQQMKDRHAMALGEADRATDPVARRRWLHEAEVFLSISEAFESDADHLLEQFEAAGGSYHRKQ